MAARPIYGGLEIFFNHRGDEEEAILNRRSDEDTYLAQGAQESQHLVTDQSWYHLRSLPVNSHSLDLWSDSTVDQYPFTASSTIYPETDRYRVPPNTPRESPRLALLQSQYPDCFRGPAQIPIMSVQSSLPEPFDIDKAPPFDDPAKCTRVCQYGVVKVKNIPFSITLQEVAQFISRISQNGKVIEAHVNGWPVHILIERTTGKTLDCYVEFMTAHDAMLCINRIECLGIRDKLRIGQRHVEVELSSQGELMSDLFPRAKNVVWDATTGVPRVVANDDPHSEGYRGFFTIEEIASIVKFAQTPQRSPFSIRCMQRPFENMISTLYKFPWKTSAHYTVAARDYLFTTYMAQLEVLYAKVYPHGSTLLQLNRDSTTVPQADREVGLSQNLLMDLLFAGLNCPAFAMRQKAHIVASCGPLGNGFPLTKLAFTWPFSCLSPPFDTPDALLAFWLTIFSSGYKAAILTSPNHGFEKYVTVYHDEGGYLTFRFTRLGSCLPFRLCVTIEQSVMKQFIEKGRFIWCTDSNLSYVPFEDDLPLDDQILQDAEASLSALNLDASVYESEATQTQQAQPSQGLQVQHNDQRDQVEALGAQLSQSMNLQPSGMVSRMHPDSAGDLNPQMPEFFPSQQWSQQYQQQHNYVDTTHAHGISNASHRPAFQNSGPMPNRQDRLANSQILTPSAQSAQHLASSVYDQLFKDSDVSLSPTTTGMTSASADGGHFMSPADRYAGRADESVDTASGSGHGPIGTNMSPRKVSLRRRTINIDSTIDEENEAHHEDTQQGGVRLPTSFSDLALSTRKYDQVK